MRTTTVSACLHEWDLQLPCLRRETGVLKFRA